MQKGNAFMCVFSARGGIKSHIKTNSIIRLSAFAASAFLFVFMMLAVFPVSNTPESTFATPKQSETEITLSTENLVLNFNIDSVDGSFSQTSANVSVTTNNVTGYNLSIKTSNAGTNASKLIGPGKSFNTISGITSEIDFAASTDYNGLWGYKPSVIDSVANTDYLPAPTDVATIEKTNQPNEEANTYTIGLGARADFSYDAGAYTNTFVITSVANPVGYTISYDKNTEDEVTNMPATQSGVSSEQTVQLSNLTPVRSGYSFYGWCDGVANGSDCTGVTYRPGGNYDIDQTGTNSVILTALWHATVVCNPEATAIGEAICMQDMNDDVASTMVTERQYQLVDGRDDKEYWVSKLADGKIWMTQNLDYDIVEGKTLSSRDTNITTMDENIYNEYEGYYEEDGVIYYTPYHSTAGPNSAGSSDGDSTDVGDWYYTDQLLPSSQQNFLDNQAGDYFSRTPFLSNGTHGHVGNYYSYAAAVLTSYDSDYDPDGSWESEDGYESQTFNNTICPAGWTLPQASEHFRMGNYKTDPEILAGSDFYGLIYYYNDGGLFGGQGLETSPAYLIRPGTFSDGILKNAGYDGYYWARNTGDDNGGYGGRQLMIRSSASDPLNVYNPYRQRSIRCIADIETEQNDYDIVRIFFSPNTYYYHSGESGKSGYALDQAYTGGYYASDINKNYNFPYDKHGDRVFLTQTLKRGGTVKIAPQKFENGYGDETFIGWNTEPDGSGTSYTNKGDFTTDEDYVILYAQWDNDYFKIFYHPNGGDLQHDDDNKLNYLYDPEMIYMYDGEDNYTYLYREATRDGYVFGGWNTEPDGTGTHYGYDDLFVIPAADKGGQITLYAEWSAVRYIAVNYVNGEYTNTVEYECLVSQSQNVSCSDSYSGYYETPYGDEADEFIGWNTDASAMTGYEDEESVLALIDSETESLTVYAIWKRPTTIEFDANGGYGEMESIQLDYGESTTLTNEFTAPSEDYDFIGWNTRSDGNGDSYDQTFEATSFSGGTVILYAQWEDMSTEKTVHYVDGENTNTVGYTFRHSGARGMEYSHTPNISDDGTQNSSYANYYTSNDVVTIPGAAKLHVVLTYAGDSYDWVSVWEGNHPDYTASNNYSTGLRFGENTTGKYGGGTGTTVEGDVYGDTVTFAFKSDYSYVGNGYGYYAVVTVASDLVYQAATGGYVTPSDDSDVFLGWSNTEGSTTVDYQLERDVVYDIEGDDKTVYAVWGKPTRVVFNSNGGNGEMEPMEIRYGTTQTLTSNTFTKDNAVFVRWNTSATGNGTTYYKTGSVTANNINGQTITLYAVWGYQTTIKFNANGGVGEMSDLVINYNSSHALTSNAFTKDGAVFVRWNTKADGTGTNYRDGYTYSANSMNGATINLYAVWGYPTTIKFNTNGGTGEMSDMVLPYGQSANITANTFTKEHSTFIKWNTMDDGTGVDYYDNASYTANTIAGATVNLYAQWSVIKDYTVNYSYDNSINSVKYKNCYKMGITSVSHTPNIADDGSQIESMSGGITTNDVVSINGAANLHVELTYSSYGVSYAWTSLWAGNNPSYSARLDYSKGIKLGSNTTGKYGGSTKNTVRGDVAGDTVTFGFYSDSYSYISDYGYGYFAKITADQVICDAENVFGSYETPSDKEGQIFVGWSDSQNATTPDYRSESEVKGGIDLNNSDEKTVYAVYEQAETMTVNYINGNETNTVKYNYISSANYVDSTSTRYLHTPNVNNDGTRNGPVNRYYEQNDTVVIPGATKIDVAVTAPLAYDYRLNFYSDSGENIKECYYYYHNCDPVMFTDNSNKLIAHYNYYESQDSTSEREDERTEEEKYGYYAVLTPRFQYAVRGAYDGNYNIPSAAGNGEFIGWVDTDYIYANVTEIINANIDKSVVDVYAGWSNTSIEEAFELAYELNDKQSYIKDGSGDGYHEAGENEIGQANYLMQDIDMTVGGLSICGYTGEDDSSMQVLDVRDWKKYWIVRAKDGNCWMTQNLDLDLSTSKTLSSLDTDLQDGSLSDLYEDGYSVDENGVVYWTPSSSTVDVSSGIITNDDDGSYPRSSDVGDWYYTDQYLLSEKHNFLAGDGGNYFSTTAFAGNGEHGHVGNYYNWNAAVATNNFEMTVNPYHTTPDITKYDHLVTDSYGDQYSPSYYYVSNSICPAGWSLPHADTYYSDKHSYASGYSNEFPKTFVDKGTNNDIQQLFYHYGDGSIYSDKGLATNPLYFIRAGTIRKGELSNTGYDGYYWTDARDTDEDADKAYNIIIRNEPSDDWISSTTSYRYTSSIDWTNMYYADRQRSVRCVSKGEKQTLNYEYAAITFKYVYNEFDDDGNITLRINPTVAKYDNISIKSTPSNLPGKSGYAVRKGSYVEVPALHERVTVYNYEDEATYYWKFLGWNTEPDGSGTLYHQGDSIQMNEAIALYSEWEFLGKEEHSSGGGGGGDGVTIQRAYEIWYTSVQKGMYEEINPGSNTWRWVDSWNGEEYQGNGRDVRFAFQDFSASICNAITVYDEVYQSLDLNNLTTGQNTFIPISKTSSDGQCHRLDTGAVIP